jgi:hypothetical protein
LEKILVDIKKITKQYKEAKGWNFGSWVKLAGFQEIRALQSFWGLLLRPLCFFRKRKPLVYPYFRSKSRSFYYLWVKISTKQRRFAFQGMKQDRRTLADE